MNYWPSTPEFCCGFLLNVFPRLISFSIDLLLRRDRREFSWRRELQNLDSKLSIMVGGSLEVRQRLVDQVLGQGGDKSSSKRSESV